MPDIVGYDPDNDYLFDPQQREPEYVCKCSDCGHPISEYEFFVSIVQRDGPVVLCEDCCSKIHRCMVAEGEIIYE